MSDKRMFLTSLQQSLQIQERNRPLEEQFPFVRIDIDNLLKETEALLKTTTKLEKATEMLGNYTKNRSDEMEDNIQRHFLKWLEKHGWEPLIHTLASKMKGQEPNHIISRNLSLVQWDVIVSAQNRSEQRLFLIEVKTRGHPNDILMRPEDVKGGEKPLNSKIASTVDYMINLLNPIPKGHNFPTIEKAHRDFFSVMKDMKLTFVYASGLVNSEVKQRLTELGETKSDWDLWLFECVNDVDGAIEEFI